MNNNNCGNISCNFATIIALKISANNLKFDALSQAFFNMLVVILDVKHDIDIFASKEIGLDISGF